MRLIDETFVKNALPYDKLIENLREGFRTKHAVTPQRSHIDFEGRPGEVKSTLLTMPSWFPYKSLGLKVVTVSPGNAKVNLPAIHGIYLFFDAQTGDCKYAFDARAVTVKRTAATSALASSYLSRPDSKTLLMMGTGALAPELIRAHATARPIEKVMVWGRNIEKAEAVCKTLSASKFSLEPVKDLAAAARQADIISCATLSATPILTGDLIHAGQHIDLVGSYRPDMREVDDGVIKSSRIFIDQESALRESGELLIPLREELIQPADIQADLFELCANKKSGRSRKEEITLFKSVGHAMEDLIAAQLVTDKYLEQN